MLDLFVFQFVFRAWTIAKDTKLLRGAGFYKPRNNLAYCLGRFCFRTCEGKVRGKLHPHLPLGSSRGVEECPRPRTWEGPRKLREYFSTIVFNKTITFQKILWNSSFSEAIAVWFFSLQFYCAIAITISRDVTRGPTKLWVCLHTPHGIANGCIACQKSQSIKFDYLQMKSLDMANWLARSSQKPQQNHHHHHHLGHQD